MLDNNHQKIIYTKHTQQSIMKMTKVQVLSDFRQLWADVIENEPSFKGDVCAKREEWNNYTDYLCKDGMITESQYDRWTNPF